MDANVRCKFYIYIYISLCTCSKQQLWKKV
jgi:hypothetical protein